MHVGVVHGESASGEDMIGPGLNRTAVVRENDFSALLHQLDRRHDAVIAQLEARAILVIEDVVVVFGLSFCR